MNASQSEKTSYFIVFFAHNPEQGGAEEYAQCFHCFFNHLMAPLCIFLSLSLSLVFFHWRFAKILNIRCFYRFKPRYRYLHYTGRRREVSSASGCFSITRYRSTRLSFKKSKPCRCTKIPASPSCRLWPRRHHHHPCSTSSSFLLDLAFLRVKDAGWFVFISCVCE